MEFKTFLRSRNISDSIIAQLEEEKIDETVINNMNMEDLARFIPQYGDRVAIQAYCRNSGSSKQNKMSLVERLRQRIKGKQNKKTLDNDSDQEEISQKIKKEVRLIEIGWVCDGKQVRTKCGGGTRKVSINRCARKSEILEIGKELFFPNELSSKGPACDFTFDLKDFQERSLNSNTSVEELFELTKLTRLRFYVTTNRKDRKAGFFRRTKRRTRIPIIIDDDDDDEKSTEDLPTDVSMTPTCVNEIDNEYNVVSTNSIQGNLETDLFQETENVYYTTYKLHEEVYVHSDEQPQLAEQIPEEPDIRFLVLHRGQVFQELIEQVIQINITNQTFIQVEMFMLNGTKEGAVDSGGVLRDALSEFFETFYETCTNGTTYKIPIIREDFNAARWNAIAKIIYLGWKQVRYFPLKLAPAFMEYCINGKTVSDLTQNFLFTLSEPEKEVFKQATTDFDEIDYDELLDICSAYDCRRRPTKDNLRDIMDDLAHKEIIQKPKFIIDCWEPVLKFLVNENDLKNIYEERLPTPKNILPLLIPNTTKSSANTEKVFSFLKKFIRECDKKELERFLRFCTGADLITGNSIDIHFNDSDGFARTPVAHTCGCVLELSASYEKYTDFRQELNAVLSSNIWVMEIA